MTVIDKRPFCRRAPAGWTCTRANGHDGPCAAWPKTVTKWQALINKLYCLRHGHFFAFVGHTLGGDWIRCIRCLKLDEYLPGVHEPKGYKEPLV